MREKLLLTLLFVLFGIGAFAQNVITGQVTDENGDPIAGAIIRVKDFSNATMSDFNGNYSLKVPDGAKILIFSYTGKETQEIEVSGDKINAQLKPNEIQVTSVVVTGLGIKRDEKKVGYAVTTVGGDDIVKSRNTSAFSSLSGKVAGVNISTASGAPGASTRVIFRGFTSLTGSNQPLYVVDGIPINNVSGGSTSLNGGTDFGNQANDINPDDIESISFLKGSAATAIYGNRAASGVIVITTKSGKNSKKGLEVTFNSSAQFSTPLRLPLLQNVYGQGIYGNWDQRENTSYGPKFDGKLRYWGHVVDGKRLIKPYSALEDNVSDFFEVGKYFMNSLSLAGGGADASYRLSFSNTNNDGIFPYDKDKYERNTISFNGSTRLSNKFSSDASVNYVHKHNSFVPTGQGGQSVWNNILQQPRDIPIMELSDITNPFFNIDNYYSPYTTNPFWPLIMNGNDNLEDRIYGMVSLNYEINPKLKLMFRVGDDVTNRTTKSWKARRIIDSLGYNALSSDVEPGTVNVFRRMDNLLNTDAIITYTNNFGDFNVSLLAGHNFNQSVSYRTSMSGDTLQIPDFYESINVIGEKNFSEYYEIYRLIGVYANVEIGYKNWLTFTGTVRNDWSSALPQKNRSFFYPGLALGFVFTDALPFFDNVKKIFPYGKIRVSYGKTGRDCEPQIINALLTKPFIFPLSNGVTGYTVSDVEGNPELTPEFSTEFEIGTDLRFFNGRYQIDFSYYNKTTENLIFAIEKAPSTGSIYQYSNLGDIKNKGFELLVKANLISKKNIDLNLSWNFTINRSEVLSLGDLKEYSITGLLGSTETYFMVYPRDSVGNPGSPIGVFQLSKQYVWKDAEGIEHPVVGTDGIPKKELTQKYIFGSSEHDFITGFSLDLTMFNFISIATSIDWRQGGWMHSRTAGMVSFAGLSPNTLYNDRQTFVVPNSVFESEAGVYVENTFPVIYQNIGGSANSYWDLGGTLVGAHEMIPKTFVKWRDLSISLIIPKKLLKRTPFGFASIGFVGNNLMLWTPKQNNVIDPELTTFGNDLEAEFGEFGATPSVRTLGFALTLKF